MLKQAGLLLDLDLDPNQAAPTGAILLGSPPKGK